MYNISAEQMRINNLLEENDGELTPEIEEALMINEENFLVKTEGYIASIKKFDNLADAVDAEIKRLQAIKKTASNCSKRLKESLSYGMQTMGYDKVDVGLHKISYRRSTAVNILDEAHIPNQYIKVETKIDKESIKRDLKEGILIPGAELVTNQNIQIR